MKKIILSVLSISTVFISSALATPEFIHQENKETPIVIEKNISDDAYISGETIEVSAKIEGDAIFAGMNITLEKDVTEDALLAGHTVVVNGNIADDIRVAAHNVNINGNIGKQYDYFEPRVDGRYFKRHENVNYGGWTSTDYRKKIALLNSS